eukprot:gene4888-7546_t
MGKKKDPNAPKRPLSAYFIFSGEKRVEVKEENPDLKIGEVAKKLGELWGEMSDAEKKPYQKKAEALKAKYQEDLKEYEANKEDDDEDEDEDDEPKKKKKKTAAKDPNAPKKPLTSYFLFLADKRASTKAENPDLNNKELVTELGRMWSALGDDEKQVYETQNAKAKAEYAKALEKYNAEKD